MGYSIDLPTCCAAMSELIMCVPYHSRALSFSHNKRWIWRTLSLVLSLSCGVFLFMSCLFTLFSLSGPSLSLSTKNHDKVLPSPALHYTSVFTSSFSNNPFPTLLSFLSWPRISYLLVRHSKVIYFPFFLKPFFFYFLFLQRNSSGLLLNI
jgi:hypothetical protein